MVSNIERIRKHKGDIVVAFTTKNDVVYIKTVKKDLLAVMAGIDDDEWTVKERDGILYVDN